MLNSQEMVHSLKNECVRIKITEIYMIVDPNPEILLSEDGVDTKGILHGDKILNDDSDTVVIIVSVSGDADIVLAIIMIPQIRKIITNTESE